MNDALIATTRLVEKNHTPPVWCPGCGDFAVLQSLTRALQELNKTPRDTVLVSGIGCSGRLPYFVDSYGFHTLHGRALPTATGVKLANPELTVVVMGGDGDGFGIGGGHVPHAARRNVDLTYLIMDNAVYGLTKGHSSPTTTVGSSTTSARLGEETAPLDIMGMLLAYQTSFIASAHSGNRPRLTEIILEAIRHPGFSVVLIKSPCPTYNFQMTFDNLRETMHRVPDDHPRDDLIAAINLHYRYNGLLDGIIYQRINPTFIKEDKKIDSNSQFQSNFARLVERYV